MFASGFVCFYLQPARWDNGFHRRGMNLTQGVFLVKIALSTRWINVVVEVPPIAGRW